MRTVNIVDEDDHYIIDDEFHCKGTLTPGTPQTPLVILQLLPSGSTQGRGMEILLSILTAQVKTGSTSENLLKEIRKIVYSFYWAKQMSIKYTIAY